MRIVAIFLFDWVRAAAAWLEQFVVSVPLYIAAPSMIVIGALDSSLLSLPEINDYLVIMRCARDHTAVIYFPLFAAAGSVLGCFLLYSILRKGGQAVLRRQFSAQNLERVERAYSRFGFLALAVPALLPPPMPFKIFVATAGALEYRKWRFLATVMVARSFRYYVEGILAVYYGERVLKFISDNGMAILSLVTALCLLVLLVYILSKRVRRTAPRPVRANVRSEEA